MQIFETEEIVNQLRKTGGLYEELLRVSSLSAGIYSLKVGMVDPQQQHTEDEVYYVLRGRGSIRIDKETHIVRSGSVIFVPALAEHKFLDIKEDLVLLVLFAPPEGSKKNKTSPTDSRKRITDPGEIAYYQHVLDDPTVADDPYGDIFEHRHMRR